MSGFIQEYTQEQRPLVNNDFTHAAAIGETGCGKTSSFILPNIEQRIIDNHGMFIIDYKGNLHFQVKALAKKHSKLQDVIEIGSAWGNSINLLANVEKNLFREVLAKQEEESKDMFWINSALNVFDLIYDLLKYRAYIIEAFDLNIVSRIKDKYSKKISTFVEITQNKDSLEKFLKFNRLVLQELDEARIQKEFSSQDTLLYNKFYNNIKYSNKKLEIFTKGIDDDRPSAGSAGILLVLRNHLFTFDSPSLNGDVDIVDYLTKSKKIVIFRAESLNQNALEGLMHCFYTRLAKKDCLSPVSLIIDEFQRTITKNSMPYVDVFREKRVELIAAFQNRSQIINKVEQERADELLLNIVSKYEYAQKEDNDLETFEYTLNGHKRKAQPIFFSQEELYEAQYDWQQINNNTITKNSGKWIYLKSYDTDKCKIINIDTLEQKDYFVPQKREKRNSLDEYMYSQW